MFSIVIYTTETLAKYLPYTSTAVGKIAVRWLTEYMNKDKSIGT
jgi:hypothetical protein